MTWHMNMPVMHEHAFVFFNRSGRLHGLLIRSACPRSCMHDQNWPRFACSCMSTHAHMHEQRRACGRSSGGLVAAGLGTMERCRRCDRGDPRCPQNQDRQSKKRAASGSPQKDGINAKVSETDSNLTVGPEGLERLKTHRLNLDSTLKTITHSTTQTLTKSETSTTTSTTSTTHKIQVQVRNDEPEPE